MQIKVFTVGPFAENTYLLTQEQEALLIDPGFAEENEFRTFQTKLEEAGTTLHAVILTHAHIDHVLGLRQVLGEYEVPVYLNDEDSFLWNNINYQAQMFGLSAKDFTFGPEPLAAQQGWKCGAFTFDVLYTPGHAPDHVSLYSREEELVIAGDALFKEGIGRTDLYKGDYKLLEKSIREQLYTLPDNTIVYPGHGPETTIGHEKKHNPFVRGYSEF